MSLADRIKKKTETFTPPDLNEGTVLTLFQGCLAKPDTKNTYRMYFISRRIWI